MADVNTPEETPMKYVLFALFAAATTLAACTGGKSEDSAKADSAAE